MQQNFPLFIQDISKQFGKKKVLENVSISVEPGEMFGLIGLNGIGKTTLIKIILGLLRQDSGSVHIFGKSINDISTRHMLSYLPEKFYPSTYLKGKEFLSLTLSYYGKRLSMEEAKQVAEKLDFDPKALDLQISKYSKGMGQKLGLLSALLVKAPLLILDEPMSGLDPRARIHLKDSLLAYIKAGNTIFFSSHILSDIDEICNRTAIMHNGKVIFLGTPVEFKKAHSNETLERAFLSAIEV